MVSFSLTLLPHKHLSYFFSHNTQEAPQLIIIDSFINTLSTLRREMSRKTGFDVEYERTKKILTVFLHSTHHVSSHKVVVATRSDSDFCLIIFLVIKVSDNELDFIISLSALYSSSLPQVCEFT